MTDLDRLDARPLTAFLDKYGLANTSGESHVRRKAALAEARATIRELVAAVRERDELREAARRLDELCSCPPDWLMQDGSHDRSCIQTDIRAALYREDGAFAPDYTSDDVHDEGCVVRGYVISPTDPEGWGQAPMTECPDGCSCECHVADEYAAVLAARLAGGDSDEGTG